MDCMKNFPYYMIAIMFLVMCCFGGMLIAGGANYIKDTAYRKGQADILSSVSLKTLTNVKVNTRDVEL